MKRWNVIVEIAAQQDIEGAHVWMAEREPDAANRWFNGIYDTIGSLEIFPERCPLAPGEQISERGNSPDFPRSASAQIPNPFHRKRE